MPGINWLNRGRLNPCFTVFNDVFFLALMGLIEWMLDRDPGCRCTIEDILLHSWTNVYVDLDDYKWHDIIGECHY